MQASVLSSPGPVALLLQLAVPALVTALLCSLLQAWLWRLSKRRQLSSKASSTLQQAPGGAAAPAAPATAASQAEHPAHGTRDEQHPLIEDGATHATAEQRLLPSDALAAPDAPPPHPLGVMDNGCVSHLAPAAPIAAPGSPLDAGASAWHHPAAPQQPTSGTSAAADVPPGFATHAGFAAPAAAHSSTAPPPGTPPSLSATLPLLLLGPPSPPQARPAPPHLDSPAATAAAHHHHHPPAVALLPAAAHLKQAAPGPYGSSTLIGAGGPFSSCSSLTLSSNDYHTRAALGLAHNGGGAPASSCFLAGASGGFPSHTTLGAGTELTTVTTATSHGALSHLHVLRGGGAGGGAHDDMPATLLDVAAAAPQQQQKARQMLAAAAPAAAPPAPSRCAAGMAAVARKAAAAAAAAAAAPHHLATAAPQFSNSSTITTVTLGTGPDAAAAMLNAACGDPGSSSGDVFKSGATITTAAAAAAATSRRRQRSGPGEAPNEPEEEEEEGGRGPRAPLTAAAVAMMLEAGVHSEQLRAHLLEGARASGKPLLAAMLQVRFRRRSPPSRRPACGNLAISTGGWSAGRCVASSAAQRHKAPPFVLAFASVWTQLGGAGAQLPGASDVSQHNGMQRQGKGVCPHPLLPADGHQGVAHRAGVAAVALGEPAARHPGRRRAGAAAGRRPLREARRVGAAAAAAGGPVGRCGSLGQAGGGAGNGDAVAGSSRRRAAGHAPRRGAAPAPQHAGQCTRPALLRLHPAAPAEQVVRGCRVKARWGRRSLASLVRRCTRGGSS